MKTLDAKQMLVRTVLLTRDHLRADTDEDVIVAALGCLRVAIVADEEAARSIAGQVCISTVALLCVRSGAQVQALLPAVKNVSRTAPFLDERFDAAVECVVRALSPFHQGGEQRPDVLFVVGNPKRLPPADRYVFLGATNWAAYLDNVPIATRWGTIGLPFGSLAAAGLAAAEAYKAAITRLAEYAIDRTFFHEYFSPVVQGKVILGSELAEDASIQTSVDVISAGAISHSLIYALARWNACRISCRVFDPEELECTNLNRYALLLPNEVGLPKVAQLNALASAGYLGGIDIEPHRLRYDADSAPLVGKLRDIVVVGVDHIPTRWFVQGAWPSKLAIGATSHYETMVSLHITGDEGCAGCAHPINDEAPGDIPTAAFVSHWAGLILAASIVGELENRSAAKERLTHFFPVRGGSPNAMWRSRLQRNPRCPVHETCISRPSL